MIDWQTDETVDWDDLESKEAQEGQQVPTTPENKPMGEKPKRRGWWRWLLLVALLVSGIVWGANRQLNRRVEDVGGRIVADVIPSHVLIQESALEQDVDLFASFLSGRDKDWSDGQQRAVLAGTFGRWDALGLTRLARDPETAVIDTVVSPDLVTVEVVSAYGFAYEVGNGVTEVVTMTQTAVYRQGETKWLYAPPEETFWGETKEVGGRFVLVRYPERDEVLAQQIALSVEATVAELCTATIAVSCPAQLPIVVDLSVAPEVLAQFQPAIPLVDSVTTLALPTPSLVALPQDSFGEAALVRGYSNYVAALLISNLGGGCCEQPLFYEGLLQEQQRLLGLRPYPYLAPYYAEVVAQEIPLAAAEQYWTGTAVSTTVGVPDDVLAVIDFILETTGAAPADVQRSLTTAPSYDAWLQQWLGGYFSDEAVREAAWFAFAEQNQEGLDSESPTFIGIVGHGI